MINKIIASIDSLCAYQGDTFISKKINKTINANADGLLGILFFSIGKKRFVLSLGMPPFIGSNFIRKKRLEMSALLGQ